MNIKVFADLLVAFVIATHSVINTVPFTAQAPLGNWSDLRQQEACEEASALMAMRWVKGDLKDIDKDQALSEILLNSKYQENNFGLYHDTSTKDTIIRIYKGFYGYKKVTEKENITVLDIIRELHAGHLVVIPTNGQALHNPYFTFPGPERHMLVVTGYDAAKKQFITNDPGTRFGKNYRYGQDILYSAIRDYPTGYNLPITTSPKNIIVLRK